MSQQCLLNIPSYEQTVFIAALRGLQSMTELAPQYDDKVQNSLQVFHTHTELNSP